MITQINKDSLYNIFGIKDFDHLESAIYNMAPSLVEYHLSSLCDNSDEAYFNRRDIEECVCIGGYSLYLDYNKNIYLELLSSLNDENTQSFW